MPGRNYSGGGGTYQPSGTVARSFGQVLNSRDYPFPQKREVRETRERSVNSYLAEDENFPSFKAQLYRMGLQLRDIPADGNCLFRALGDQLEGHCRNHFRHRAEVVAYMRAHRHDFEPFIEDDVSFDDHVKALHKLGTHAGNDAIVAFAKLHNVNVVIHQLRGRPILIQGPTNNSDTVPQLHLSYHNGQHYSSVRRVDDNTESPAQVHLQSLTAEMRSKHRSDRPEACAGVVSAKRGLEDIEAGVALATNCRDKGRIRQVLLEHDYDVDASIADLLQQMKLSNNGHQEDSQQQLSRRTHTADNGNGALSSSAASSNCSSPNSNSSRVTGSVLKANGHSYATGKGHKVHFRDDSLGSRSSGYESLHSYSTGKVHARAAPEQQHSHNTIKETKSGKIDKKKPPEDSARERTLEVRQTIPQASAVRDVTVVGVHNGRVKRY